MAPHLGSPNPGPRAHASGAVRLSPPLQVPSGCRKYGELHDLQTLLLPFSQKSQFFTEGHSVRRALGRVARVSVSVRPACRCSLC